MSTDHSADVVVLGLGIMGLATAYSLARRGHRVLGLEQFELAHDLGSSHGRSRMIRRAYFEGAFYVPLINRAYDLWDQLEQQSGRPLYHQCGGLFTGPEDGDMVRQTMSAARAFDIPLDAYTPEDAAKRFPQFRFTDGHIALHEPGAGYVDPLMAHRAFHDGAIEAGAPLQFNTRVDAITPKTDGGAKLFVGDETITARNLVITLGAWAGDLLGQLGLDLALQAQRVVLHWFEPQAHPTHFASDQSPANLWELADGSMFYGFPSVDGEQGLKYGFHTGYRQPCSPDQAQRTVDQQEWELVQNTLKTIAPDGAGRHLNSKTCFYTCTPDDHFAIGPAPGLAGIYIAGGFSGHGFKFAPAVGELTSELVENQGSDHLPEAFAPDRLIQND